ncbi:MAG: hypothetical protein VX944_16180 [Myxococcota bacterium]|nr:hypothetical protein [Myxococcota bacterium]MEC9391610.1 hypothetical protein [Myxococcota bacterium]
MAALIDAKLGVRTRCVEGGRGVFDVIVDGITVASKQHGEFPTAAECVEAVAARLKHEPPTEGGPAR